MPPRLDFPLLTGCRILDSYAELDARGVDAYANANLVEARSALDALTVAYLDDLHLDLLNGLVGHGLYPGLLIASTTLTKLVLDSVRAGRYP